MRAALAMIALCPLGAGCFYTEPINERPSADIERDSEANPARGDEVKLHAEVVEPDGDPIEVAWTALACDETQCDEPLDRIPPGNSYGYEFDIPLLTLAGTPTTHVEITLRVTDALGAETAPTQNLDLPVGNALPVLVTQQQGRTFMGKYPVNVPMTIVARKSDPDDGAAAVVIETPVVFAPDNATLDDAELTLVEETDTEVTYELVASEPGNWEVHLTAHDPFGPEPGEDTATVTVPFADDQSPCLTIGAPAFPPEGSAIVLDELRHFAVLAVEDDLDVWPAPSANDPYLDAATFRWFLGSPATGGTLTALAGVDGSGVDLDPASYAPGDELTLRVEVSDREDRPLCDPALDTCAAVPGCLQRQTWHVEVR